MGGSAGLGVPGAAAATQAGLGRWEGANRASLSHSADPADVLVRSTGPGRGLHLGDSHSETVGTGHEPGNK